MAATTIPGQFKEAIEAAMPDYEGKVWRLDHLPDGMPLPYITVFDYVTDTPMLRGDGRGLGFFREVQVDHWQSTPDASEAETQLLKAVLDGLVLHAGENMDLMSAQVTSSNKIPDEQEGIDHTAISVRVKYVPALVP